MIVIPAIDITKGKCVRLYQGNFQDETIYGVDPLEMAKKWEAQGAQKIHIVDLDGAKNGIMENKKIITTIAKNITIPIQVGGGIRDEEVIKELLFVGVSNLILGTRAISDFAWISRMQAKYAKNIIVALDVKSNKLLTDGWKKENQRNFTLVLEKLLSIGIGKIIYTDVLKDGTLLQPNFAIYKSLQKIIHVIAAGGVSTYEDLVMLEKIGITEVIVGKALYEKKILLSEVNTYVS